MELIVDFGPSRGVLYPRVRGAADPGLAGVGVALYDFALGVFVPEGRRLGLGSAAGDGTDEDPGHEAGSA